MAKLPIAGLALALVLAPEIAFAQMAPPVGAPPVVMQQPTRDSARAAPHTMRQDRWSNVPGGHAAYRRPAYGYQLPRYWMAPSFYVSNYGVHGLARPAQGFGWSRYYDDMVLTDRHGRVYAVHESVDDYGGDGYRDSHGYSEDRRRSGLGGAAVGAVVGGVAGNVIAGNGNRLAGTLIGGGVGAIAGGAIDRSRGERRNDRGRDARGYEYEGRWTGSWDGGPVRSYDGRFEGGVRPHWDTGGGYASSTAYGYGAGCCETVTTTTVTHSAPVTTRTMRYITEYVHVPAKRRSVKRAKPRCAC